MTVSNCIPLPVLAGPVPSPSNGRRLTRRQAQIIMYLACGCSVDDIARALCTSPATVQTQIASARGRLRVHSAAGLVAVAIVTGEVSLEAVVLAMRSLPAGEGADCD